MITTAVISFREFLEVFLIVGVFLGISRKLNLKKEFEIGLAAVIGIVFSLLLATGTYLFGNQVRGILTEKNAELLESYLMIFSGLFLAYVIFSLHNVLRHSRAGTLIKAQQKLQENAFDISLFFTIIFLVIREGFEIALFTASTSLFSVFIQNFIGLMLGFVSASILGIMTFFAYIKFSIGKVFKITEYMIIILGASLVQNGVTKLLKHGFNIDLSRILSLNRQPFNGELVELNAGNKKITLTPEHKVFTSSNSKEASEISFWDKLLQLEIKEKILAIAHR